MGLNPFRRRGHQEAEHEFVPTGDELSLIAELRVNGLGFREAQEQIGTIVEDPLRRKQVWGLVREQRAQDRIVLEANRPGVERL